MSRHTQAQLQIQTMPSPWPGGGPSSPEKSRPPLSPRGYSAAAATGQSRFVEGSMNDRVSAAPPAGFVHGDSHHRIAAESWERHGYTARNGNGNGDADADADATGEYATGGRYALRRPRSSAGWVTRQAEPPKQKEVTKKGSFWEKLLLRGSRSSGSIGRVVDLVVGGGGGSSGGRGERERRERGLESGKEREKERQMERAIERVGGGEQEVKMPDTTGYPSREEVLESYKNLVASGFFDQHAIRGGRHPGPAGNTPAMPSPKGKSFADHMATQQQQHQPQPQQQRQQQQQQQQLKLALSIPPHKPSGTMCPPPPPPRTSSKGKPDRMLSPQRGTKRGASIDLVGDAETTTRKLVKKLRHSASRLSVEFGGSRENQHYNYAYGASKPRHSTSSYAPSSYAQSPLSPTSPSFSPISIMESVADEALSPKKGQGVKLTKPKEGGRRRHILGLGRKLRSPSPAAADADVMMVDQPEHAPPPPPTVPAHRSIRNVTPPPAGFRSHSHSFSQRMRASSVGASMVGMTATTATAHEPLSVVPDPNMGIPVVPRIPREFCAVPEAAVTVAVTGEEQKGKKMMMRESAKKERKGRGKGKEMNRDSGLGEDVENIPVWA